MSVLRRPHPCVAVVLVVVTIGLAGCGREKPDTSRARAADPGPVHVHGLGVNPADGALFIATHTGLFRASDGERRARRVAGRFQDTMGFTVVGPDRFLGSGHPDLREKLPPFLGLIESRDAGDSWRAVSLQGDVDFHVLEASGGRIYGYGSDWESREPRFLTSDDRGRSWERLDAPEALLALAISPADPRRLIASGERGVFSSRDAGRSWSPVEAPSAGLLAWTDGGVFVASADGRVWRNVDNARSWEERAPIGGAPAAFDAGASNELLVALHDGTVKRSMDDGQDWSVRAQP